MEQTIRDIRTSLDPKYSTGEIESIIRLLFEALCGYSWADIILHKNTSLSPILRNKIEDILFRLLADEPIQYILGSAHFAGMSLWVGKGVLIPRPETEELVSWVAQECTGSSLALLDVCTGSGCIALALAKWLPTMRITACDISADALAFARTNAARYAPHVMVEEADALALSLFYSPSSFDVIVSNPPYVCRSEQAEMESRVVAFEPELALFVEDNDPLLFYCSIAQAGYTILRPGGTIYFEINARLARETTDLLTSLGYIDIEVRLDISGRARMIRASRVRN